MTAPYRIARPGADIKRRNHSSSKSGPIRIESQRSTDTLGDFLGRLIRLIPGEVIALYTAGAGIIPQESQKVWLTIWAGFCLLGTAALRIWGTRDATRNKSTDWAHVAISTGAFVVWLYSLGGPFELFGVYVPFVGTLLVLAYAFVSAFFYKGPTD